MNEMDIDYLAILVKRSINNDSDAFAELYGLTYNKVYNYARHYLRDDYLAQDAMQEIYILALKNLHKLNDPKLFIAWLNRISFNVCYNMSKKLNTQTESNPEVLESIQDTYVGANPEIYYQLKDDSSRLNKALDTLPFHEKQVIIMKYYNNMKLDDIATAMGASRSTIKRYIAHAQKVLKKQFDF